MGIQTGTLKEPGRPRLTGWLVEQSAGYLALKPPIQWIKHSAEGLKAGLVLSSSAASVFGHKLASKVWLTSCEYAAKSFFFFLLETLPCTF